MKKKIIVIRGGGDLASGVVVCLHEAGYGVVVTELPQPLVVRRAVSFAEAVYEGYCNVEGIVGRKADNAAQALDVLTAGEIAVLVDPDGDCLESLEPIAIVDGRMLKREVNDEFGEKWPVIGLGPGFTAGVNCWVAIETNRGQDLGKIIHTGSPEPDTGLPANVMGIGRERVIYAHRDGRFKALAEIGDVVEAGQKIAEIEGEPVMSQIKGIVRGMLRNGLVVQKGVKLGDVDPTSDSTICFRVSDKARKIGAAVVEALREIETAG
jgi:xanthine dehydrogenase accessory factor